jgi:D-alanyl-D-alanine carboxypeptidase
MNRKRTTRGYSGRRPVPIISYVLGAAFLLVAVIFSVKGFLRSSAEPSTIPSQNVTAPMPSLTPSPSGIESPDPAASDPTPTATTPTTAPVASPTPVGNISYEVKTMKQDDIYQGKLILINANHPYRFFDFENFVCLYNYKTDSYKVGDYDLLIAEDAIAPLNRMLNDFYYNTGVNAVLATSGHRTYEYQQYLFDKEVALVGPEEAALWVAQPGASEHHSGLAIDFAVYYDSGEYHDYDGSGDFAWINENCHKYGYIVRYKPDKQHITGIAYEPWHFRYLGVPHATKVTELELCYEEYIDYLRDYSYDSPLSIETDEGEVYKAYYCEGLNVYVPKNIDYEISGNNIDGFIVTYKAS